MVSFNENIKFTTTSYLSTTPEKPTEVYSTSTPAHHHCYVANVI